MILLRFIFVIIILTTSFGTSGTNIVVIDLQQIIDRNSDYKTILDEIEKSQEIHLNKFDQKEKELNNILNEIEEAKLILNDSEVNNMIYEYNESLNKFSQLVERFNYHFQNEIVSIRKKILNEIVVIIEQYAAQNEIELVLDANNYLISSNTINITDIIEKKLNRIKIKLEFKDFEKN